MEWQMTRQDGVGLCAIKMTHAEAADDTDTMFNESQLRQCSPTQPPFNLYLQSKAIIALVRVIAEHDTPSLAGLAVTNVFIHDNISNWDGYAMEIQFYHPIVDQLPGT